MEKKCLHCGNLFSPPKTVFCTETCHVSYYLKKRRAACEARQKPIPDLDGEVWKDVVGYNNMYMVSNLGRVKSVTREHIGTNGKLIVIYGIIRKCNLDFRGYPKVSLKKPTEKIKKTFSVHRLVAIAFIPNPDNKPEVNHINGIRNDNRVENLEWATHLENMQHAKRTGLFINCATRRQPLIDTKTGIVYKTIKSAADAFNINPNALKRYISNSGKNKTTLIKLTDLKEIKPL
jgi:hypothetical protein